MATPRIRDTPASGPGPVPAFFLYGEPLQPPDERIVHIETIAARSRLHDWHIQPHRHHDLHQLLLLDRGNVTARIDGAVHALHPPALILLPPGVVHSFCFRPGAVGLVVSFATGRVPELQQLSPGVAELLEQPAALALERKPVQATDLLQVGAMLLREYRRSAPGRHLALRGLLAALLANALRLIAAPPAAARARGAPDRELVARFRRLIELRFREHASLAAYARELRVTPLQLRRACIGHCGQPPIDLVHLRLLVEAERQLRYTTMSIAQVAYYLGFNDPAYFTRFFTKRKQLSPRRFRERDETTLASPVRS